jgi:glycosyltransferase involved in cell wall biosynthesis
MGLSPERDVLLFFEDHDRDTFVRNDRFVRRFIRKTYKAIRPGRAKLTGFEVWFRLLRTAMERAGMRVHVNDRRLARENPQFPIGICGSPFALDRWTLPNPAVLGPGMLDHPAVLPDLMKDPRFKRYVTTCDWNRDMFAGAYGDDRCVSWYAGIDLEEWPDLSHDPKDVDVLIYDKVRWRRDHQERVLLQPIRDALNARGLRWEELRYGRYNYARYRDLLSRSRTMIFLCEHETQGMAYQEAMASNVPILAWDPGSWADPNAARYTLEPIPACSVPYFGPECGERFREPAEFEATLDRFWARRESYRPRTFVSEALSLEGSARLYREALSQAASMA